MNIRRKVVAILVMISLIVTALPLQLLAVETHASYKVVSDKPVSDKPVSDKPVSDPLDTQITTNAHFKVMAGEHVVKGGIWELEGDEVIYGTLEFIGSAINLNGYKLTVLGDFIHSSGTLTFNEGSVVVEGGYRLQKKEVGQDGIEKYTMGTGYLMMKNDADYMLVKRDFIMESYYQHSEGMKAGTIEVKGDFRQIACAYRPSFYGSGTHKVILSGRQKQIVEMQEHDSRFNILELKNTSKQGIEFISDTEIKSLYTNEGRVSFEKGIRGFKLEEDVIINGNVTITGDIDLNAHELTVKGDLINPQGGIYFNKGRLNIEGDYRLQRKEVGQDGIEKYSMGTGYLMMLSDEDYMLVNGDFIMESYYQHSEAMKAGTIEVKGNFKQIACYYTPSFYGSGTHKVILSGEQKQIVEMQEHDSRFNVLELENTSTEGIEFISDTEIISLHTNGGKASFEKGIRGLKLEDDVIINGNVTITGHIDLNAHELTVRGDLINPQGGIYFNKGRLNIEGDYRLQRKEVGQDGIEKYSMGSGYLMMLSDEDYMLVNGDFIMESYYQHSEAMKAGTIEVKGDFRQIACYYTPSFYGSGTHKVILSGNKIQTVEMQESNSRFNTLITTKPLSEYIFLPSTREVFWVQHIYDPNAGIGIGGADGNQPNISKQMTSMFTGIVYQECKVDQDHGRLKATLNDVKFEKSNNIIRIKGNIEVEGQTQMFNLSGEYFRIKDEPFGDRTYISLNSDSTYDVLACSIQKDAHLRTLYDEKAELEGKDVFRITLKDKNNNRIIDIEDKIENYKSVIQNVPYEDTYQNNVIKNDMDTWFVDYVVRREISYNPDDYIDNTSSFNMDGLRKSKLPIHGYFYNTKGEKVYYGEGTNLIMGVTMAKVFTPEKDTNINNQMIVVQNSNNKEGYAFINTVDPRLKTVHTNFLKWEVSLTQPDNNGEYIISLRIAESAEYLYAEAPEGVPENWGDKHKFYKLGKAGSVPQNKIKMKDIKVTQKLGLTGAKGQPDLTFFAGGTDIEYSGEEEFNAKIIIPIAADLATITPWPVGLSEIVMPRVYAAADIYRQLKKIEAPIASSDDKIFGPWQTHMQKMLNNGEDPFYWYPIEVNGFGPTYIPQLRKSSTIIIEELMLNEYEDSLQIKSKIGALTSKSNIKEKPLTNDTQVNEMMETIKHVYVHGASRGSFEKEMEVIFEFDLITKAEVINKEQPIKLTYSIRYY